jgi:hypothetical protein
MHHSTKPTEQQTLDRLDAAKTAAADYARAIDALIPDGPSKTIVMHKLRTMALVISEVISHT